jgi:hypothetical protein
LNRPSALLRGVWRRAPARLTYFGKGVIRIFPLQYEYYSAYQRGTPYSLPTVNYNSLARLKKIHKSLAQFKSFAL